MSVFCLGLQGSDHHEGSAERSSNRPQPAEEEIRRSLHALPPDPPQNHRSQFKKKKDLTTRPSACISVISLQNACLMVDFALLFLFRRLRLRWERWWGRRPSLWLKPNLQLGTSGENQREITWRDVTWRDVTWRDVTWRDVIWYGCVCNSHL